MIGFYLRKATACLSPAPPGAGVFPTTGILVCDPGRALAPLRISTLLAFIQQPTRAVSSTFGARLRAGRHPQRCRLYLAAKAEVTKAEVRMAFDLLCLSLGAASYFPSAFCEIISGLTQDVRRSSLLKLCKTLMNSNLSL